MKSGGTSYQQPTGRVPGARFENILTARFSFKNIKRLHRCVQDTHDCFRSLELKRKTNTKWPRYFEGINFFTMYFHLQWPFCMFMWDEQISPPNFVLKLKSCQVVHKWIPESEQLKRIFTPKEGKCKEFCLQTTNKAQWYDIFHNTW